MPKYSNIFAGIDVGGSRKGFHAAALQAGHYYAQFASCDPAAIADWCRTIGAQCIGIDAPCHWADKLGPRPAERELMAERIFCFSTPLRKDAEHHRTNHYGWMLQGEKLYAALRATHPLYCDNTRPPYFPCSFETFPQAVACALAGCNVPGREKSKRRRQILMQAGINITPLTNIDKVDAALCAVCAQFFAAGNYRTYGEPNTGYIVVPAPAFVSPPSSALPSPPFGSFPSA